MVGIFVVIETFIARILGPLLNLSIRGPNESVQNNAQTISNS